MMNIAEVSRYNIDEMPPEQGDREERDNTESFIRIVSISNGYNIMWIDNELEFSDNSPGYNRRIIEIIMDEGPIIIESIEYVTIDADMWNEVKSDHQHINEKTKKITHGMWETIKSFGQYQEEKGKFCQRNSF